MNTSRSTFITTENVIHTSLLTETPRLTPTGKISHAKTRVYTQRYRKEWEQMPDFKGWLTSVTFQPTRAYCIYCKKNLHAHRLSLLKHTCTMKHQRAALAHEAEEKQKEKSDSEPEVEMMEMETMENSQMEEGEENEENIEYIVEKLDTDDEEESELHEIKGANEETVIEEEEEEKEIDLCAQLQSDDDDSKPVIKKIKLPTQEKCRDTLAEAMAHVHSEYLEEEVEDQENVQIEMVVEESVNSDMQMVSVLSDPADDVKETIDNEKIVHRSDVKTERKLTGKVLEDGKSNLVVCPLPMLGTTYQVDNSSTMVQNTINVMPITNSSSNKTITLTSGGKTLTLTGGTFQPGTQYVLSKIKGKGPNLIATDKKPITAVSQNNSSRIIHSSKISQAGTSQQSFKKSMKSAILKKLRISTHVVDTTKGLPIGGLQVSLYKLMDGRWTFLNESNTSSNGRCTDLVDDIKINCTAGRYKIHFDVDKYFTLRRIETMYPFIEIVFDVKNLTGHYHIPLLLSPFGYSTYRGS